MVYGLVEEQRGATKKNTQTVYQNVLLFYSLNKTEVVWMIKWTKYCHVVAFDSPSGPAYWEKICPDSRVEWSAFYSGEQVFSILTGPQCLEGSLLITFRENASDTENKTE